MPASKRAEWKHENNGAIKIKLFWRKYNQKAEACFIGMCLFLLGMQIIINNTCCDLLMLSTDRMSSFCKSVQAGGSHLNPSRHYFHRKENSISSDLFFCSVPFCKPTSIWKTRKPTILFIFRTGNQVCFLYVCLGYQFLTDSIQCHPKLSLQGTY